MAAVAEAAEAGDLPGPDSEGQKPAAISFSKVSGLYRPVYGGK